MVLVGKRVIHAKFGNGTITDADDKRVSVLFDSEENDRPFQYPTAFVKFLKFENKKDQSEVENEIETAEASRKAEEERLKIEAETRRRELERQAEAAHNDRAERTYVPRERITGQPFTFLVFQGATFTEESSGGFIWAPKSTSAGGTCHHWERLKDVREGDVIFHCAGGYIKAISCAKNSCFDDDRPEMFEEWEKHGRRVELDYYVLKNPIKHGDYKTEILKYSRVKYSPFDINGNGVLGYLFDLDKELAKFFLEETKKANPELVSIKLLQFLY